MNWLVRLTKKEQRVSKGNENLHAAPYLNGVFERFKLSMRRLAETHFFSFIPTGKSLLVTFPAEMNSPPSIPTTISTSNPI